MPYPQNVLRLVLSGTLYAAEGFSYGIHLARVGDGATRPLTVPPAVKTACEAFHGGVSSSNVRLNMLKLNEIGVNGKYVSQQTVMHDYLAAPFVPTGGISSAPQVALAVTLDTGIRRGLAASGRFYIPMPRWTTSADGRLTEADVLNVVNATTTWFNALHTALPGWRVCVASNGKIDKDDSRMGAVREVQSVRVGRVLDTIRSRRTSLNEAYVKGPDLAGYTGASFGGGGGSF